MKDIVTIEWREGTVRFLDQTRLPEEEHYIETTDYRVVGEGIRNLSIRGAPAIGVGTAYAVVLAVHGAGDDDLDSAFHAACDELSKARPTAVNLFGTLDRMRRVYSRYEREGAPAIRARLLEEAEDIRREDQEACRRIGEYGATLIASGSTLLTHCNTGALATAGEGTAQAIITAAAARGTIVRVYADETRPLLQGARLTAWELKRKGVPVTLITDSTAAFLMQQRKIDAVVVGADRIAANGDTANKIGTYGLAVLAAHHGIPFYVAAPVSTVDRQTPSGEGIPVEERNESDVTHIRGRRIAAEGVDVYAPAFDVTPNNFITAIVTDAGILHPPYTESIARLGVGLAEAAGRDA